MTYSVFLHPKAAKFLEKLDELNSERIKESLRSLQKKLFSGERLSGMPFWKLRIGDYRAIYEIDEKGKKIIVLFIGHRKNVYDDFSKLM
ncbi:MAG TPA: type II toxin-antitoxin system RelE/ParE family toxin [archaeon]|nr:type II toxin-antitoxin system RelE/ParE family toxin [archaeon]